MPLVRFGDDAVADVEAAYVWYLSRSQQAAANFRIALAAAVEAIGQSPERFAFIAHGCRRCPIVRFPFSVVFRETAQAIQIVAVAHASRRPNYWRERLA